jgi:hypothetical protein
VPARAAALLAATALVAGSLGCKRDDGGSCTLDGATDSESVLPEGVRVFVDTSTSAVLAAAATEVRSTLAKMWGASSIAVERGAPDFSAPYTVWITTSSRAEELIGSNDPPAGYQLARVDEAADRHLIIASAHDAVTLSYAAYALLEVLGARFFHPRETLIPELGAARFPRSLHIARAPAFAVRGLQPHVLHPIEWFNALNGSTDADFTEATQLIDWLVKTGQNHVQWPILSTVPFAAWKRHASRVIDYAHSRGVTAGVVVQLFGGSSLQNNYVLVKTTTGAADQIDAQLDALIDLPWDQVEIAMGEFIQTQPENVISWLDHAVAHVAQKSPRTEVSVENHVGNYPNLFVQYQGMTEYFYHLPEFADPRLVNSVHSLYFFDLYRDWAMYGHDNFFFQRDYLLGHLSQRKMRYFPESAYWLGADDDVPLFLPEYVHARWIDIHNLASDVAARGLPPIQGHVMFTSGHEWGYWMTDYLVAQMLWDPSASEDSFLAHYAEPYGSCASRLQQDLRRFIDLETKYLFDQRLVGYVAGENEQTDLGVLIGFPTHPMPVPFDALIGMSGADRAKLGQDVVAALHGFAGEIAPIQSEVSGICARSTPAVLPWCKELEDGIHIVRLRAEHSALLYEAVLAALGQPGDTHTLLGEATKTRTEAQGVIAAREPSYRFDLDRLIGAFANPTIYGFGYLRQTHTACFWLRREAQAQHVIETRSAASPFDLPSCLD